jgi:hypothetical protein
MMDNFVLEKHTAKSITWFRDSIAWIKEVELYAADGSMVVIGRYKESIVVWARTITTKFRLLGEDLSIDEAINIADDYIENLQK